MQIRHPSRLAQRIAVLSLAVGMSWQVAASSTEFDGEWKGTFECGPLLVGTAGAGLSQSMTMTVRQGSVQTNRATDKYREELRGRIGTDKSIQLEGEGHYTADSFPPWQTMLAGSFSGNRLMAGGAVFGLDGTKRRDCKADLTRVAGTSEQVQVPAAAPQVSSYYSNSYELVKSLEDGRSGKIAYKSVSRNTTVGDLKSGRVFLNDTVHAVLSLPSTGKAPFPVMVIAHSSAGVQNKDRDWARWFNEQGIATLLVDTFTPRGITQSATDQSVLYYGATIGEYLVALKLLATHPAIDIKRAGIIGFSRGGVAAMATGIESIRRGTIGGDLKYAVHFPVYGGCAYRADRWTGAPMHQFVGSEDSYEDIEICRGWQEQAKAKGVDANLTVFPGVHHGFDNSDQMALRQFPNAEYWKDCKVEWNIDAGQFRSARHPYWHSDNSMVEETAACKNRGVTVKYDEKATADLKVAVREKLKQLGFI